MERFREKPAVRHGSKRVRLAFRHSLTRPSALATMAGIAGVFGFWLGRRPTQPKVRSESGVAIAAASGAVIVKTYLKRYAMSALPFILQQFRMAGQARATRDAPDKTNASFGHGAQRHA